MLLEIIATNAIIIGFIFNVLFVEHPDSQSYTIYFAVGLLLQTPFLLLWWWWRRSGFGFWLCGRRGRARRKRYLRPVDVDVDVVELQRTVTPAVAVESVDNLVVVVVAAAAAATTNEEQDLELAEVG